MTERTPRYVLTETRPEHFPGIIALSRAVYPESPAWSEVQLASHLQQFPEGQLVAIERASGRVVGMAASLIVLWDDYDFHTAWRDMTDRGMFTNHDPTGHTLYGAEVMVDPEHRRRGIGRLLYAGRRDVCRRSGLLRIRAGARLRGYGRHAHELEPEEYVRRVIEGELTDPTLTFQLRERFQVLAVVPGYLRHDPESLGWAAVIEWLNHAVARRRDFVRRDRQFLKQRRS